MKEIRPSLVTVAEAHCVSLWGHDFRPDYFRLGEMAEEIGSPRIIAMTSTAALPGRQDVVERLRPRDQRMIVNPFERDNITLRVVRCTDPGDRRRTVLEVVQGSPRTATAPASSTAAPARAPIDTPRISTSSAGAPLCTTPD